MMNAEEREYMDYLIHNRTQLTNQITRHLDEIERLEKQVDLYNRAIERTDRTEKCLNQEGQIVRLQNLLEVSEKAHYKTLQQLAIATKALREYADPQIWEMDGFCYKDGGIAEQALKEIDLVGTSVSLAKEEV